MSSAKEAAHGSPWGLREGYGLWQQKVKCKRDVNGVQVWMCLTLHSAGTNLSLYTEFNVLRTFMMTFRHS